MGRKLRSMFKPVTPRPGSGDPPRSLSGSTLGPSAVPPVIGGLSAGSVVESVRPGGADGTAEAKGDSPQDVVAKLAYERWLETGAGAVENWAWAEAEYKRRGG